MNTRPATTVILLRDAETPSGMEVFMLRRHRRSGFLPNAWVFPGGRVDPDDGRMAGVLGGQSAAAGMGLPLELGLAYLVAGARETFEEAGIWLGDSPPPASTRNPLNAGTILLADLLAQHGSTLELDRVHPWSWWVTPEAEPKRYDTRFLVARTDEDGIHDEVETTDSRWVCPKQALALGIEGFPMAPPTWWTLLELLDFPSVDAVFAAVPERVHRPIQPVMSFTEHGMQLLLPGHPEHPDEGLPGLPHEVRRVDGNWVGFLDGAPMVR